MDTVRIMEHRENVSRRSDPDRFKRPPLYRQSLDHYPAMNPIFITAEYRSLKIIHTLHGLCLLCQQPPKYTDLSCCFQREIWVLYSQSGYKAATIALVQAVQQSGAAEIVVIRLSL